MNYLQKNNKLIHDLNIKPYFPTVLAVYNNKYDVIVNELIESGISDEIAQKQAYKTILSYLHDIMRDAQPLVEAVIAQRIKNGEIINADQARKSIAGNTLQQLLAYSLVKNIEVKNIDKPLIVSMSAKLLKEYAVIRIGEDTQKPDSDVLVYSEDSEKPIINFSCKTSCRERAGQTFKWKLLSDLATCNCPYKNENPDCPSTKYNLDYHPQREIQMCFVTTDFYNELQNPQITAMFNFFDNSYVAKTTDTSGNIKKLENVIDDINSCY